jgi:hypothetical protein
MPRSSGTYTLPAGNPVVTGTTITSTWANTTFSDVATALTGSVATDGTSGMTGILQMGNNKITGVADGTASSDVATVNQISNPTITGGTIDGAPIGAANPKNGAFLALSANTAAFSGTSTAVTVTPSSDNSTKIATTAFVQAAITAISSGVTSFNTRSGAVTLISADVTTALGYTPYNAGGATVVTSSNFNTYAPTLSGTGAVGTWGISISGNAATASTASTATTVTNGVYTNATNNFTSTNNYSTAASIVMQGVSVGDQRIQVIGAGVSSGLAPSNIQIGASGVGIIYSSASTRIEIALSGVRAYFDLTGSYQANNSPNWATVSDINIKTNLRPINSVLDKINALKPCHFEYKNKLGEVQTGFIAQEFATVFPGHTANTIADDKYKEFLPEGETKLKAIDMNLTAYLVKAIQELSAKVDAQAAQIAALQG